MTLAQIKTLLVGVLRGWFTNKKVLDKFSESGDGSLQYNGSVVGGNNTSYTDEEISTAVTETLAELNNNSSGS